ncbi:NAD(P)/FAD-dependent oxidoreductase [Marinobacter xestospongiae]|uniref:NAD(P)/FAD-dependent oxidoreductase n=1 Tax=Marinobacter xestospongiae TaxID=994319 RepID=UPI003742D748
MVSGVESEEQRVAEEERLVVDTVVIGAGVVGLATARSLALRGQSVWLLEAGPQFGEGISSRNSEVIHAGIYYPTGSLKAQLCVRGREQLYAYCRQRSVSHRRCGKWIVAVSDGQADQLEGIQRQAADNGVPLTWRDGAGLADSLPDVAAAAALFSPETGIVDSHQLMLALLGDLEAAGGTLVYRTPVLSAESGPEGHRLQLGGELPCQLVAKRVVNAAGLSAIPLARQWAGFPSHCCPQAHYARGVYFSYSGRHRFEQLIYPVPEPGGLGVHLTLDLAGQARFGPDVEWISEPDYTVDPARAGAFADGIRQWWPGLDASRLQPAYAGVRPKLRGPGEGNADFLIQDQREHGVPGLVHLFGIESPGLTACLAIADEVAERLA